MWSKMWWSNIPFYFEVGSSIALWNHPFFVGLSWYPRNFQPTWHVATPHRQKEKSEPPHCVGSAPVKLPNRGLLCVVESDTKRALQPKWYPIKSLRKMEKLHPKHKTTPRRASNFFFFSNLTTRTLEVLTIPSGLSIHGKDRNPNVFKSRLEPARYPLSVRNKTHQQTNWAAIFFS